MKIIAKRLLIIAALAIILGSGVVVFSKGGFNLLSSLVRAQTSDFELFGWLWSDNYGWISLNCANTDNCAASDYKVVVSSVNEVGGYGWSSNVGWVCFGKTCPTGGSGSPAMSLNNGVLSGWGKILSLGNDGWINFSSQTIIGVQPGVEGAACYDCEKVCLAWTQQCAEDGNCVSVPPCLQYDENNFSSCRFCLTNTRFDEENIPEEKVEAVVGGSGYLCTDCIGSGVQQGFCRKIYSVLGDTYRIDCGACSSCRLYGGGLDNDSGRLVGWGWNGFFNNGLAGAGWVRFVTGGVSYPWLETEYGSVYASSSIRQKSGLAYNNATYCIFADTIENVASADCGQSFIRGVNFNFPHPDTAGEAYYNALGKIDVAGLTTVLANGLNKYGNKVNDISTLSGDIILNDAVYVRRDGDLHVSGTLFKNGDTTRRGNGLIVVDGDLYIDGDLWYADTIDGSDNKKIGSVGWLVKGDVIVSPNVTHVVGAFIVVGNGQDIASCRQSGGDPLYPHYNSDGCGTFFSSSSKKQLTVSGLIFAKAFDFQREYAKADAGAEKIVYDGRFIANPPTGFKSFAAALPVITDSSY